MEKPNSKGAFTTFDAVLCVVFLLCFAVSAYTRIQRGFFAYNPAEYMWVAGGLGCLLWYFFCRGRKIKSDKKWIIMTLLVCSPSIICLWAFFVFSLLPHREPYGTVFWSMISSVCLLLWMSKARTMISSVETIGDFILVVLLLAFLFCLPSVLFFINLGSASLGSFISFLFELFQLSTPVILMGSVYDDDSLYGDG